MELSRKLLGVAVATTLLMGSALPAAAGQRRASSHGTLPSPGQTTSSKMQNASPACAS